MTNLPKQFESQDEKSSESPVTTSDSPTSHQQHLNRQLQNSAASLTSTFSEQSSSRSKEPNTQPKTLQNNEQSIAEHKKTVNKQRQPTIGTLASLNLSTPIDCFVQLVACERRLTKDGNPFFKVNFRDARQSAHAILWSENL